MQEEKIITLGGAGCTAGVGGEGAGVVVGSGGGRGDGNSDGLPSAVSNSGKGGRYGRRGKKKERMVKRKGKIEKLLIR